MNAVRSRPYRTFVAPESCQAALAIHLHEVHTGLPQPFDERLGGTTDD